MNSGERDELIFKIYMTYKRDQGQNLFGKRVNSVGFMGREFGRIPIDFNIYSLNGMGDFQLESLGQRIGCTKAPTKAKADVCINGENISLKSLKAAPAALVNHTARPGFEFACAHAGVSIDQLDIIIDEYWKKRIAGVISEDTRISDPQCPFSNHKDYLGPVLEYFLFDGTGSSLSCAPADSIIEFSDPFDERTYKRLSKQDAVNEVWPKLIFSLRAKKGMPADYDLNTYSGKGAASIARWVKYQSGDYRGALHIRTSR